MGGDEKFCIKCESTKLTTEFCVDRRRPDGRAVYCKSCHGAYYHGNKEAILRQYKEYRSNNKEYLRGLRKAFDKRRFFYKRASNLLTRRTGSSGKGEIRKTLPGKCAEISRLWKSQRGICPLSGRRLNRDNAQLDHIQAVRKDGSDDIENLRWVHRDVNYAKRDLSDEQFLSLCFDVVRIATQAKAQA